MRKLWSAVKHFFLPPAGTPAWLRLLPFAVLGIITIFVAYGSVEAWNYTNSSEFCGTTCHTMPPEYSAYLRSPHARVKCTECHIGRDVVTTQVTRKAGDLRHVILTLTQDYEFPIYTRNMRPARQSCETCHFPEKFSDDSLREIPHFGGDNALSPEITHLILKTGGGTRREGLGRGIHWHIENDVYYLAEDPLEQQIPYVRVVEGDGSIKEYYDIAADFTPQDVAGQTLEKMDCITCHNRITHEIPDPMEAVDQAMLKNLLPRDLPEIREQAIALISHRYENQEEAIAGIAELDSYYATNHPEVYAERQEEVETAQATLLDMYSQMVFPEQKIDWQTHPNNLGHSESPGCFRCHDGKHLTGTEEAIRLECNLCHSVPVVTDGSQLVTEIELVRGPEPPSHIHTSWITLHGKMIDSSCASCHEPAPDAPPYTELEGKPPPSDSFCGNVACHANEWEYTGFDAEALDPVLERQRYLLLNTSPYLLEGVPLTYEATFQALFEGRCTFCHSGTAAEAGLDLSSYETLMAGADSGPVVIPNDPDSSRLIAVQSGPRDHFGQVLPDELDALRNWVLDGAPRSR